MGTDSIDANIIIHGILGDVPGQRELVVALFSKMGVTHHISTLAIMETVYVLNKVYGRTRQQVCNSVLAFLERYVDCLDYDETLIGEVFPVWVTHSKLSFVDCLRPRRS